MGMVTDTQMHTRFDGIYLDVEDPWRSRWSRSTQKRAHCNQCGQEGECIWKSARRRYCTPRLHFGTCDLQRTSLSSTITEPSGTLRSLLTRDAKNDAFLRPEALVGRSTQVHFRKRSWSAITERGGVRESSLRRLFFRSAAEFSPYIQQPGWNFVNITRR